MDEQGGVNILGFRIPVLVAISSLVGAVVFLLSYVAGIFPGRNNANSKVRSCDLLSPAEDSEQNSVNVDPSSRSQNSTTAVNANGNTTSGKRAKNKKRREAQQEFTHPWIVGALKGHTGPVLDINFSSNGKFLASCAEDCELVPEEEPELGDTSSSSSSSSGEGDYILADKSRRQGNTTGSGSSSPSTVSSVRTNNELRNNNKNNESLSSSSSPSVKQLHKVRSSLSSSSSSSSLSQGTNEGVTRVKTSLSRRQRKNRTRAPREQQQRRVDRDEDTDELLTVAKSRHRHHHRTHHQSDPKLRYSRNEVTDRTDTLAEGNLGKTRSANSTEIKDKSEKKTQDSTMNIYWLPMPLVFFPTQPQRLPDMKERIREITYENPILQHDSASSHWVQRVIGNEFTHIVRKYIIGDDMRGIYGYPVLSTKLLGAVFITNSHRYPASDSETAQRAHNLDANAEEFVPSSVRAKKLAIEPVEFEIDSGTGSGSSLENSDQEPELSSDSDKNSDGEGYPRRSSSSSSSSSASCYHKNPSAATIINPEALKLDENVYIPNFAKQECSRCRKTYGVDFKTQKYEKKEKCIYHWGRLTPLTCHSPRYWQCCNRIENEGGCTSARKHVWSGLNRGKNGPYYDYVSTQPRHRTGSTLEIGVYAIDCEMCYTIFGLELTRVTVVSMDGRTVYDTLVKPLNKIIDYNTRFSGITCEMLSNVEKTLHEVQRDLTSFIFAETVLIGHGLNNDLRALKLYHSNVVDTACIYSYNHRFPIRPSLQKLAQKLLHRNIQQEKHNSIEDATTAADLVISRVWSDLEQDHYRDLFKAREHLKNVARQKHQVFLAQAYAGAQGSL